MARSHGKILVDIWIDADWFDLSVMAQWVMMMLLTQPRSSTGPTFDLDLQAWASLAANCEPDSIWLALLELEEMGWVTVGSQVIMLRPERMVLPTAGLHVDRERGRLTLAVRVAVFARDEAYCRACFAEEDLAIDHIIPLSRGGTSDLDNLAILCRSCNSSKGSKPWREWLEGRRAAHS